MRSRAVSADERERAPLPDRAPQERPSPSLDVLALQRSAGNRAVAELVRARAPQRAVQRFGVRAELSESDGENVVESLTVVGRPKLRLIPGAEGSHVTAWAVFADIARRRLAGLELLDALSEIRTMLREQRTQLERDWPALGRPDVVTTAIAEARLAEAPLVGDARGAMGLSRLQERVAAYLTLHNLRPGTAVLLGRGQAIGAGEPQHLSTLRRFETGEVIAGSLLHTALFGLLDARALGFIHNLMAATTAAPGVDPGAADRVGQAVLRALEDLAKAYPRAYAAVVTSGAVVDTWLTANALPTGLPGALPAADITDAAPAGWSAGTEEGAKAEVNKRTAVCQIELDPPRGANQPPTVRTVRHSGRPPTLVKGEQGHHTVAWSLEVRRLDGAMLGKPLPDAATALCALADETLAELDEGLTFLAAPEDTGHAVDTWAQSLWSTQMLTPVRAELVEAIAACDPAGESLDLLVSVQSLAEAWMRAANALPLTSALKGAPANTKGEGVALGWLRAEETRRGAGGRLKRVAPDDEGVRQRLFTLLDREAVQYLRQDDPQGQGYPVNRDQRVGVILRRFLKAAEHVFPMCYRDADIGGDAVLRPWIERLGFDYVDVNYVMAVAHAAPGADVMPTDAPPPDVESRPTKRSRRNSHPPVRLVDEQEDLQLKVEEDFEKMLS